MKRATCFIVVCMIIVVLTLAACGGGDATPPPTLPEPIPSPTAPASPSTLPEPIPSPTMVITSMAFADGEPIPQRYGCDGQDISPELRWSGAPEGTMSLALICDDPDAPGGTFTHWVVYNIPGGGSGTLTEGLSRPGDILQGRNSFGETGYGGPCPPRSSMHRYLFTLYALDTVLELAPGANKTQLLDAMEGHILAEAVIMGTYQR